MKFYRYEIWQTGGYDEERGIYWSNAPKLDVREFNLHKETPKGYWIAYEWNKKPFKWIPKESVKRYAYPTKKEALTNFIHRKRSSIKIMEARLISAREALELAEKEQQND